MGFLKRLLCMHLVWFEGPIVELLTGKRRYTCRDCGQSIERVRAPISYIRS